MEKIKDLIKIVGDENKRYIYDLIETDQMELLNHEGLNEITIFDIIKQIKEFEVVYPDGLVKYVERAKTLLKKSERATNKYANCMIEQPDNLTKIKFQWKNSCPQFNECSDTDNKLYMHSLYVETNKNGVNTSSSISNNTNEDSFDEGTVLACNSFSLTEEGSTPVTNTSTDEIVQTDQYSKNGVILPSEMRSMNKEEEDERVAAISAVSSSSYASPSCGVLPPNISVIEEYIYYENIGLQEIDRVCFILLAGGLGERLNHKDIKLKLITDVVSEKTYIEYYCNYLKAFQDFIKKNKNKEIDIPFIIMLSDDTYEKTIDFFQCNKYFFLKKSQIYFLKQKKVFCFKDNEAHLDFIYKNNTFYFSKKPHGHGDIHSLINKHIEIDDLVRKGYKYLYFFQDTNALAIKVLFVCLGVTIKKELHMNFLAISRKPGEEIGAICKCTSTDTCMNVVNIEYNLLGSIIEQTNNKELVDTEGYSLYPGNTGAILFEITKYNEILKKTKGIVPEYMNPKYTDNTRQYFMHPTRVESMMQDFAYLYFSHEKGTEWNAEGPESKGKKKIIINKNKSSPDRQNGNSNGNCCCNANYRYSRVGVTQLDRALCFSAVKNNSFNAQRKTQNNNVHPECIYSAEADLYYSNCAFIELACTYNRKNFNMGKMDNKTFNGVRYCMPPKVLIEPQFAFTLTQLINKIKGNILISNNSTLWIKSDTIITNLYLDGTLVIERLNAEDSTSTPFILDQSLYIKNRGYELVPLHHKSNDHPDNLKMRGYKLVKREALIISG
ncbi:UTP--glucose-1-phosphate uridylyltransferase, putative [Plasmodium malariae]|uniref:UTP-monosaccharide-1-phosphate uridylyltransferase n=1 Tax=Plasmodium malariae TaxID=5858 RepID=A0A1C3KDM2_PLAMA|nr:UTP--glucose-1-phosphate uridylyltransferase, putative [Plasmodium malariae]